jgi:hypothetical protein
VSFFSVSVNPSKLGGSTIQSIALRASAGCNSRIRVIEWVRPLDTEAPSIPASWFNSAALEKERDNVVESWITATRHPVHVHVLVSREQRRRGAPQMAKSNSLNISLFLLGRHKQETETSRQKPRP